MKNPLRLLHEAGQSVWLDYLHRRILTDGALARMIEEDGVSGLTSNPAIFEQAIAGGDAYDVTLAGLIRAGDDDVMALYERLAIADIQAAADAFRGVYDGSSGRDGYVSLEVSPYLAMDAEATVCEARRLWRAVDRPNLMIKAPGTSAGAEAIRTLITEGVNVNVTLLFALDSYLAAAEAHLAGLEARMAAGRDVSHVHGVASFFVSRIDSVMDQRIDARPAGDPAHGLRGRIAIANARLAYQHFKEMIASPRWRKLAAAGAAPQRLLWASTGTKDPAYSDVLYVENLIGAETVDTLPPKTLDAFRDHGRVRPTLDEDIDEARRVLSEADRYGLDLAGATAELSSDGVAKFAQAFDGLLAAVAAKRTAILGAALDGQKERLPPALADAASDGLGRAAREGWTRRLWARDASLWTGGEEANWLGWLDAAKGEAVDREALARLAILAADRSNVLFLGMGGSSLAPEVLATMIGPRPGRPRLVVLDSTDPAQIARIEASVDPSDTLFVVASKSGSTLEPDILLRHFFARAEAALGSEAAERFVAVTDPGSDLEARARRAGFALVLAGRPDIGGRYSALSHFGMAAAAVLGLDVPALLVDARMMAVSCGPGAPPTANPGVRLGIILGLAARQGRDKVTLAASPSCAPLGAWLEQLLAESTGKHGVGLIPVDGEPQVAPAAYGSDRVFVSLSLTGERAAARAAWLDRLVELGHPVVEVTLARPESVVQEFVRWEVATAIAGAVIGIDPFDQPDVEASKLAARRLSEAYERGQAPARATPIWRGEGLAAFAEGSGATPIEDRSHGLEAVLAAFFALARAGAYIGLLAWLDRSDANTAALQDIRARILGRLGVATVLGFGPRYLHSTGQAYKGGPNSGLFLALTGGGGPETAIPGRNLTFGQVEAAQALGDLAVLAERGRRVLRVDLGDEVEHGLARLQAAIEAALR